MPFRQLEKILDPLTELAREGARRMLAEALKAEADAFAASFANEQLEDGRQRIFDRFENFRRNGTNGRSRCTS